MSSSAIEALLWDSGISWESRESRTGASGRGRENSWNQQDAELIPPIACHATPGELLYFSVSQSKQGGDTAWASVSSIIQNGILTMLYLTHSICSISVSCYYCYCYIFCIIFVQLLHLPFASSWLPPLRSWVICLSKFWCLWLPVLLNQVAERGNLFDSVTSKSQPCQPVAGIPLSQRPSPGPMSGDGVHSVELWVRSRPLGPQVRADMWALV